MDVSNAAILFVPCFLHPPCNALSLYSWSYGHVRHSMPWGTLCYCVASWNVLDTGCVGRNPKGFQTETVSHAPLWLSNPLFGEYAPFTYIQTQQNTRGPELRSCVQSSGLTAGTVKWHLYYVPWGVPEDRTSICFPSLLPLQSYRNQAASPSWHKRTRLRGTMQPRKWREVHLKCVVAHCDPCIWLHGCISTFT